MDITMQLTRPIFSYSKIQRIMSVLLRNRKIQVSRIPALTLMNIGCGVNIHPEFINLDYNWNKDINLCWDITNGLPVADCSMDGVFTEHCLEHIEYDQCYGVLSEIYRILKPGGVVRIILPDGGLYIKIYQKYYSGEKVQFPYVDSQGKVDFLEDSRFGFTPMMAVNRIFRGYGHLFAYDIDTLSNLLKHVGFESVEQFGFRTGRLPTLLIDSELRAPQSFVVEGVRKDV